MHKVLLFSPIYLASNCSLVFISHIGLVTVMAVKPVKEKKSLRHYTLFKISQYYCQAASGAINSPKTLKL